MKSEDAAILVNTAFSLVELIVKLRQQSPNQFSSQEEKILKLKQKLDELEALPEDYLQNWEG